MAQLEVVGLLLETGEGRRKQDLLTDLIESCITDSAGRPMTPHSPASPPASSSPEAGNSAPLVR